MYLNVRQSLVCIFIHLLHLFLLKFSRIMVKVILLEPTMDLGLLRWFDDLEINWSLLKFSCDNNQIHNQKCTLHLNLAASYRRVYNCLSIKTSYIVYNTFISVSHGDFRFLLKKYKDLVTLYIMWTIGYTLIIRDQYLYCMYMFIVYPMRSNYTYNSYKTIPNMLKKSREIVKSIDFVNSYWIVNLHTSLTWFGFYLIPRFFRRKRLADKSKYNGMKWSESTIQKVIYRLYFSYPIIINIK